MANVPHGGHSPVNGMHSGMDDRQDWEKHQAVGKSGNTMGFFDRESYENYMRFSPGRGSRVKDDSYQPLRKSAATEEEMNVMASEEDSGGLGKWLADSPVLTSTLAGAGTHGLTGALVGALAGKAGVLGNDTLGGAIAGGLAGTGLGALNGVFNGLIARKHIKDRDFRRGFHKSPGWSSMRGNVMGQFPMVLASGLGAIPMTAASSIIGAAGHNNDSRTWDVFWGGGGVPGAIASALDHKYYGRKPLKTKEDIIEKLVRDGNVNAQVSLSDL